MINKGDLRMSKGIEQEKEIDIIELVEVLSLDAELELDNDIREWLQTPPVQIKNFGFDEVDKEDEYNAIEEELSNYLMER